MKVAAVKRLLPVAKVLYQNRKAELGILLAAGAIVRQILQALGH